MKKYVLLISVIFIISLSAKSQIIQEKDYSGSVLFAYLEGDYYYSVDYINNECFLYGNDHVLSQTISLTPPADLFLYEVAFVSRSVFNKDELMEMLVVYYNYMPTSDTSGYYYYTTQVVSENGSVLVDIPDGAYSDIIKYNDGSLKLMVYLYDFNLSQYPTNTLVYSLPGELSSAGSEFSEITLQEPWPNPASNSVNIPFHIENDNNAELILMDVTGRQVNQFTLDTNTESIMINISQLKPGQYIYYIETGGRRTLAKKIIVR